MKRIYDKNKTKYIDLSSGIVFNIGNNKILNKLGKKDIKVLELLVINNCKLTMREDLMNHGWFGRVVTDSVLNVSICNIRKILLGFDPDAADIITTVNGFGYYFNISSSTLFLDY